MQLVITPVMTVVIVASLITIKGLVAVAFALAATGGLVWLASRIYTSSLLRFGARIPLREALRRA